MPSPGESSLAGLSPAESPWDPAVWATCIITTGLVTAGGLLPSAAGGWSLAAAATSAAGLAMLGMRRNSVRQRWLQHEQYAYEREQATLQANRVLTGQLKALRGQAHALQQQLEEAGPAWEEREERLRGDLALALGHLADERIPAAVAGELPPIPPLAAVSDPQIAGLLADAEHAASVAATRLLRDARLSEHPDLAGDMRDGFAALHKNMAESLGAVSAHIETLADQATPHGGAPSEAEHQLTDLTGKRVAGEITRLLSEVDKAQTEWESPTHLRHTYRVEQRTIRIRRHIERTAVLNGRSARRSKRPEVAASLLRMAAGEVDAYQRVTIGPSLPWVELAGYAVPELALLLAELIENGTKFSSTTVSVNAITLPEGLAIDIEDQGVGIYESHLKELNRMLAQVGPDDKTAQVRRGQLGLITVACLADKYHAKVELLPGAKRGTRARVLLPANLVRLPQPRPQPNTAQHTGPASTPVTPRHAAPPAAKSNGATTATPSAAPLPLAPVAAESTGPPSGQPPASPASPNQPAALPELPRRRPARQSALNRQGEQAAHATAEQAAGTDDVSPSPASPPTPAPLPTRGAMGAFAAGALRGRYSTGGSPPPAPAPDSHNATES
ncbi:ATP-binding protein [Actinomadura harenae]